MKALRYGPRALLIECADPDEVAALHAELRRRREARTLPPFDDLVPAEQTVLIDGLADPAALAAQLVDWDLAAASRDRDRDRDQDRDWNRDRDQSGDPRADTITVPDTVTVPVVYDGPDLEYVADLWQLSPAEAVAVHSGLEYLVAFCGFAPGFAYLTGLPQQYHLPRRSTPRTTVPAGSVAVAGPYTGVYPRPSPGGWHLLGRTDAPLWDLARPDPALLTPGTRVRFEAREA